MSSGKPFPPFAVLEQLLTLYSTDRAIKSTRRCDLGTQIWKIHQAIGRVVGQECLSLRHFSTWRAADEHI